MQCDTLNGNCVLIPKEIAETIGNLKQEYTHKMGDMDYGFRAQKQGFTIWTVPGYVGFCDENQDKDPWLNKTIPIRKRWQLLKGPKGAPFKEYKIYTRQAYGFFWPIYWVYPYIKFWITVLLTERRCNQ